MNRTLLAAMLGSRDEIGAEADVWTVGEGAELSLLLAAQNGQVPLAKVHVLTLGEAFLTVKTADATYCLPYERVVGFKVETREVSAGRPGFRR